MTSPGTWRADRLRELTIGQVLRDTAARFPERDAAVFPQFDARLTWSELDREADRVARALWALGLRRGDHFGVWSTNVPRWTILQLATARIGVVLVTINPAYRRSELEYVLGQSELRGLALIDRFKSSDYLGMLRQACPELDVAVDGHIDSDRFPRLRWVVQLQGELRTGMLSWDRLLLGGDEVSDEEFEDATRGLGPEDPINLQYTSGTTGRPKGALLSHRNLLLNALYAGECQRLTERDRVCIPVPMYHCFGCVLGNLCAMVRGATMVFPHESFRADATLEAIERERCTSVYGVPTMFIAMLEHPDFAGRDTSSLRTGIMAGSPCPIELMKRVAGEMGASEITIAYGQTESSPLITMTRTDDPIEKRVGTVGRPIPGVEVRVRDPETGETMPDGVPGELRTRGHNVMLGYYNEPDATARAIDSRGWLHTGDQAIRQPDGYFRITGRLKDLIIRGGENISPREIEELLYEHPAVEDVQVVGVPDRRFGEEIMACVRARRDAAVTEDDIRDFCRSRLAPFKTPKYVWMMDEFPTTVTGKVQKYLLRRKGIERFGLEDAADIDTA